MVERYCYLNGENESSYFTEIFVPFLCPMKLYFKLVALEIYEEGVRGRCCKVCSTWWDFFSEAPKFVDIFYSYSNWKELGRNSFVDDANKAVLRGSS